MVARVWHGWTRPADADRYEDLLKRTIFPEIAEKGIRGYRGIELLRRAASEEVEFITIMWFESWEAVRKFAGDDPEVAYVPPAAREILARHDERSSHYEVRDRRAY